MCGPVLATLPVSPPDAAAARPARDPLPEAFRAEDFGRMVDSVDACQACVERMRPGLDWYLEEVGTLRELAIAHHHDGMRILRDPSVTFEALCEARQALAGQLCDQAHHLASLLQKLRRRLRTGCHACEDLPRRMDAWFGRWVLDYQVTPDRRARASSSVDHGRVPSLLGILESLEADDPQSWVLLERLADDGSGGFWTLREEVTRIVEEAEAKAARDAIRLYPEHCCLKHALRETSLRFECEATARLAAEYRRIGWGQKVFGTVIEAATIIDSLLKAQGAAVQAKDFRSRLESVLWPESSMPARLEVIGWDLGQLDLSPDVYQTALSIVESAEEDGRRYRSSLCETSPDDLIATRAVARGCGDRIGSLEDVSIEADDETLIQTKQMRFQPDHAESSAASRKRELLERWSARHMAQTEELLDLLTPGQLQRLRRVCSRSMQRIPEQRFAVGFSDGLWMRIANKSRSDTVSGE